MVICNVAFDEIDDRGGCDGLLTFEYDVGILVESPRRNHNLDSHFLTVVVDEEVGFLEALGHVSRPSCVVSGCFSTAFIFAAVM